MAAQQLTLGDLIYKLGFENEQAFVDALERTFKEGEAKAKEGGGKAGKSFSDTFKATFSGAALGSFVGNIVGQAFNQAIGSLRDFARDSVREFATYEQGLVQLRLAGETNLAPLEARIKQVAEASRVFSVTDVSLAVGELVKAGFDADTALTLVAKSANTAASEVDPLSGQFANLGQISTQIGGILRALNLDISETDRVVDVLAKGAQDSSLDVSELVDIIAEVGPISDVAGVSLEELAAAAAVLSNRGVDAATIGRGLRSVLTTLIDPPKQVKAGFDQLGISLIDRNGEARAFGEVLENLYGVSQSGARGVQYLASGFDTFGLSVVANAGRSGRAINAMAGELQNAEGESQRLADAIRGTAVGSLAEMEARINDAKVALGQQLAPTMVDVYNSVLPGVITALGYGVEALKGFVDGTDELDEASTTSFASAGASFRGFVDTVVEGGAIVIGWIGQIRDHISQFHTDVQTIPEALNQAQTAGEVAEIEAAISDLETNLERLSQARQLAEQRGGLMSFLTFGAAKDVEEIDRQIAHVTAEIAAARGRIEEILSRKPITLVSPPTSGAPPGGGIPPAPEQVPPSLFTPPPPPPGRTPRTTDPLVEEARRVQAHYALLKLQRDADIIDAESYEDAIEAHLRRLGGMYERSTTNEQKAAILAARGSLRGELDRMRADIEKAGREATQAWTGRLTMEVETNLKPPEEVQGLLEPARRRLEREMQSLVAEGRFDSEEYRAAANKLKDVEEALERINAIRLERAGSEVERLGLAAEEALRPLSGIISNLESELETLTGRREVMLGVGVDGVDLEGLESQIADLQEQRAALNVTVDTRAVDEASEKIAALELERQGVLSFSAPGLSDIDARLAELEGERQATVSFATPGIDELTERLDYLGMERQSLFYVNQGNPERLAEIEAEVDALTGERELLINTRADNLAAIEQEVASLTAQRELLVAARADGLTGIDTQLEALTREREALLTVEAPDTSAIDAQLDALTRQREALVNVHISAPDTAAIDAQIAALQGRLAGLRDVRVDLPGLDATGLEFLITPTFDTAALGAERERLEAVLAGLADEQDSPAYLQAAEDLRNVTAAAEGLRRVQADLADFVLNRLTLEVDYEIERPEDALARLEPIRRELKERFDALKVSPEVDTGELTALQALLTAITGTVDRLTAKQVALAREFSTDLEARLELNLVTPDEALAELKPRIEALKQEMQALLEGGDYDPAAYAALKAMLDDLAAAAGQATAREREASDERLGIYQDEYDARQAQNEQFKQLADNRYAYEVEAGIVSRERHLENLRLELAGYEEYSDEWIAISERIRRAEADLADEREGRAAFARQLEVDNLQALGRERDAALAEEQARLERELEQAGQNAELRAQVADVSQLRIANIHTKHDQKEADAQKKRVADIIGAEKDLTEAKRLELTAQLEAELVMLGASTDANSQRVTDIKAALSTLEGTVGVDIVANTERFQADLENLFNDLPRQFIADIGSSIEEQARLQEQIEEKRAELSRARDSEERRRIFDQIRILEEQVQAPILAALTNAMGTASDFFVGEMMKGILGPIASQLAASIVASVGAGSAAAGAGGAMAAGGGLAAALGPIGIPLLLGAMLLPGIIGMLSPRPQPAAQRIAEGDTGGGRTGSTPAINIRVETSITVNTPPLTDPRTRAMIADIAQETNRASLQRTGLDEIIRRRGS